MMKIKTLGCYGGQLPGRNLTGLLLDGSILIDAGTVGLSADIREQRKIKAAFISHAHLDHIGALPFYAVNIVSNKTGPVRIFGSRFTLDAVKNNIMNGVIWPDFTSIKNFGGSPVFKYEPVEPLKWIDACGYRVMPVGVNHSIPTVGYLIGKNSSYILYSGDTKDTDEIWKQGKKLGKKLKAAFIELAFPDEVAFLAESSCHLTPGTLEKQLAKLLPEKPKIFVYHIKPEYIKEIKRGLKKIKGYDITIMDDGLTYKI
ncbi:MAG: 3',5'-cyclic-nucleotide phosphodiesterase [Candidatus Goldiibacteriota bacterium]|jgi:cAMP phosphodiesterase